MSGVDTAYAGQSPSITGRNGATRTEQELAPRPTMRKARPTHLAGTMGYCWQRRTASRGGRPIVIVPGFDRAGHNYGAEGSRTVLVGLRAGPVRGIRMPRP